MLEHIAAAIRNAPIEVDPWPHVVVDNVFPNELYTEILANIPLLDALLPFAYQRWLYWIVDDNGAANVTPFWTALRAELFKPLQLVLEDKFGVTGIRYGAEILYDKPGYSIAPHTDSTNKLITGLFYLPKSGQASEQGTILYHGATPDPSGKGHKFTKDFEPRKIIPYVPNSALFFKRTDISFHGVRPTPVDRCILAYDLFWK